MLQETVRNTSENSRESEQALLLEEESTASKFSSL